MQQPNKETALGMFRTYYTTLFPVKEIFRILKIDENREITFQNSRGAFIRFETFPHEAEFIRRVKGINPFRIDIGAIYDKPPKKMNGANALGKELVFDIDLTDYPRVCCEDKKVCEKCYEIIKCSVKIMDYILREEFGFTEYGFVFSGRRGVHCWILNNNFMNETIRNDIFNYFNNVVESNLKVDAYSEIMDEFYTGPDQIQKFFPRLDKQVTVKIKHLIKMPFSIHPDTLNISIPLDPENITEFYDLPTLMDVLADSTRMEEYVKIFSKWRK